MYKTYEVTSQASYLCYSLHEAKQFLWYQIVLKLVPSIFLKLILHRTI